MISVRHTNNRQSFKKVTCPFKSKVRKSKAIKIVYLGIIAVFSVFEDKLVLVSTTSSN